MPAHDNQQSKMARRREMDLGIPRAPLAPAEFSWTLFARFPRELQLEILERCHENDLVCLSVTSRFFRSATLPLIPAKPSLLAFQWNMPRRRSIYQQPYIRTRWQDPCDHDVESRHRRECPRPGCVHCLCTTCPLYTLLASSMGARRKFCFTCRKFTKRSKAKSYRGRCKCCCSVLFCHDSCDTRLKKKRPDVTSGLHGRTLGKRRRTNHGWSRKKKRTTSVGNNAKWHSGFDVGRYLAKCFQTKSRPRAPATLPPPGKGPRRSPRTPVPRKMLDYV